MEQDHNFIDTTPPPEDLTPLSMTPPATDAEATGETAGALADVDSIALEPEVEPEHIVLLCGGGHMAQEVALQARHAGFAVDVVDERAEYVTEERFPMARRLLHCRHYADIETVYPLDNRHYVVILTHSYETDMDVLLRSLHSPARYIGVAGSERKKENIFSALRESGIPDSELACVRCPIGLHIGAESTEEMGIAITAELIAARAGCLQRPPRPRHSRRSLG